MASSVLPGERRWGSTRRGGMTVLGKVAVPKPVNLPSQRLENHGLDPNVEIVPKGTLSWGSRSTSSAQNAWGSSSLSSPNTDGGTGSSFRLNDRPSSGGSGTRPSTAGSEKSHEPLPNIWVSNSRPSSASGVLAPNKTLTSASRPRSAETRPGSSQLSRFADPVAENSVAWGPSRTAEKLGVTYGKDDGFTLSSGDFPTLGSEKHTESGHRSQERPVSASGRVGTSGERTETLAKEDEPSVDATRNDWRKDNSPFTGAPPRTDKWWMDTQTYPDPMMNSQQFGPWHGPVHNAPDGVWYRGPSGGPPYRPPGPPGPPASFPVEPFPYYHPRLPAQPPGNMQPVPRAVSGPGGYHANNGNSYRPHGPDPYMQPVMPVRPGAYAVPVPYEGYYGPPRAGFCNPNDRDPIVGMGTGPCGYNRFPVQNAHPEIGSIQSRHGGYDSTSMVMSKEHDEPGQHHGTHTGPYKVLLKQHDSWEVNDGKEKMELDVNEQHRRAKLPGPSAREIELRAGGNDELVESSKLVSAEEISQSADARGEQSSGPVKSSLPERMNNKETRSVKASNDFLAKKPEVAPIAGDAPQKNISSTKRIPTLIEKIEGLNNKVRNSDGRFDAGHVSVKDVKPSAMLNARTDNVTKVARSNTVSDGKVSHDEALASHEREILAVEKKIEAPVPMSTCELQAPAVSVSNSSESRVGSHSYGQRRPQGVQSRTEHYGKPKPNHLEGDEWRKKPAVADAVVVSSSKNVEPSSHKPSFEFHSTEMTSGESDMNRQGKSAGESNTISALDSSDHKAQRVKMREIAAQRARQLQKEEEERTREQKAKALAKLEELNRRTLTEASTERTDNSMPSSRVILNKQEETPANSGPPLVGCSGALPSASLDCNLNSVGQTSDKNIEKLGDVTNHPKEALRQEALPYSTQEVVVKHNLPLPSTSEISKDSVERKIAVSHDSGAAKQKQTGNKRKQITDNNLLEGSISFGSFGDPDHGVVVTSSSDYHWPSKVSGTDNQSVQQKKKNNRNGKNKQKGDALSTSHVEENPVKASDEAYNLKNSNSSSDATTFEERNSNGAAEIQNSQLVVPVTDQGLSTLAEETNNKLKHQSKPQPARWMPKNAQTNRADKQHNGDNVVWAPVRSPINKTEASEGAVVSTNSEAHIPLVNGHEAQNKQKSKRAEMERYVPKPVAKELSQQGNLQRPSSSSVQQVLSDENAGRTSSLDNAIGEHDGSTFGKGAFPATVKSGENKHNKHGKAQGLWRQRVSAESSSVNPAEGSSFSSNPSKAVQVIAEQNQSSKAETNVSKERRHPESSNSSNSSLPTKVFSAEGVSKDQGVTGRGKRQTPKGHKVMDQIQNNSDNDLLGEGTFESVGSSLGSNQSAGRSISGENQSTGGHSSSHWQPKPQGFVDHNRQTTKGNGGQKVVKAARRDSPPQGGRDSASRNDKQNSRSFHPQSDSVVHNINVTGAPNLHHDDADPERKVLDSSEGGSLADQLNMPRTEENVLLDDVTSQHGRSGSSGFRRHGHFNGRYGRGQETTRGNRNSAVQEGNKQVRVPGNGERRKNNNNSHYEYHPARSYNAGPNGSFEEDSRGKGSRYREKGQNHSRHGRNYYERESGNIQVTVSYDKGE